MKADKKRRLERAGWRVGGAEEFLGLTKGAAAFIEMKLALARALKRRRLARNLTQVQLSGVLGSSQSRIAKMEAADRSVSLDLLVRSLFAVGATRRDLARMIRESSHPSG